MSVSILLLTHEEMGAALITTAHHILGRMALVVEALAIPPGSDAETALLDDATFRQRIAKLSSEEAFNVFTSVLELKGFTLIQVGKVYKVVPLAAAKQSGTRFYSGKEKGPINESYVARVITLENIPA